MKISMYSKFLSGLFLLLCSCSGSSQEHFDATQNENLVEDSQAVTDNPTDSLLQVALTTGDTSAFYFVHIEYSRKGRENQLLFESIIMAHRYDYTEAYYFVYYTLSQKESGITLEKLDSKTRKLAVYYLLQAYEKGCKSAKYDVKEIFEDKIPKSTEYFNGLN